MPIHMLVAERLPPSAVALNLDEQPLVFVHNEFISVSAMGNLQGNPKSKTGTALYKHSQKSAAIWETIGFLFNLSFFSHLKRASHPDKATKPPVNRRRSEYRAIGLNETSQSIVNRVFNRVFKVHRPAQERPIKRWISTVGHFAYRAAFASNTNCVLNRGNMPYSGRNSTTLAALPFNKTAARQKLR